LLSGIALPLSDALPALYGKIAKNILASGDWLTLHHDTMRVVDKPPLTFWLMSLSFAAFGATEWALRGWHVGLALTTVVATYALARLALSRPQALLSALILLTSVQFFYESLTPEQHVPLMLFVTLAVYWHLRWEREGRTPAAVLAWLAGALAVLTIGIVGFVLPAMVIGLHLLLDRPTLPPRALHVAAAGAGVFMLVAAPWFVVGALRQGYPFIDTFFLTGTLGVGRYFHHVIVSPEPRVPWWQEVGTFLLVLPPMFQPWIGWFWPALREGWEARRARGSTLSVCFLWVAAVLAFFSLSLGDKVGGYLMPIFPPLAVLAGSALTNPRWNRQGIWLSLIAALAVSSVLSQYLWHHAEARSLAPLFLPAIVSFLAAPIGYALGAMMRRSREALAFLVLGTLLAYGLAVAAVAHSWDRISPWRPLAAVIDRIPAQGTRLLVLGQFNGFADFYIARPIEFAEFATLARAWQTGPVLAVAPRDSLLRLPAPVPRLLAETGSGLTLIANFSFTPSVEHGH
jgi:4-amino-4-deoxy-L-arabinose transferase-like glycosyltransferase